MFSNYLKTALRSMRRHMAYTMINILGLSVGLVASFLILLWVQDEMRYDRFHEDVDQLYRVMRTARYGDGQVYTFAAITAKLDEVLDEEFPEITMGVLQGWEENMTFSRDDMVFRESGRHAGKDFFKMFSYPFLAGDPAAALDNPTSVVLSEALARKYFGPQFANAASAREAARQILGEMLRLDNRMDVMVTGVVEDLPAQSSVTFDFVLPVDELAQRNAWMDDWGNNGIWMYVKLAEGADAAAVSEKIRYLIRDRSGDTVSELFLQPYTDMYLRSKYENGELAGGRIAYVRIFSFVSFFILILASINFINLATARNAQRSLEVGIRKTFGGSRKSLTGQFLGESVLLTFFSLILALGALYLLLPGFNALTQKQITLGDIDPVIWGQFFGIALLTGMLSGIYPAVYLSGIKLMDVLRKGVSKTAKGRNLRRGLVVFQFAVSIILIVGAITVYNQMNFISSKNLGLDRENVMYSVFEGPVAEQYDVFRNQLLQDPSILNVTTSSQNPLRVGHSTPAPKWDGKDPEDKTLFYIISANLDFIKTMGMKMAEGRAFSRAFSSDSMNVIVNETAARAMGMDTPIGQRLALWNREGQIIGVVKDFHMNSMYNPIEPLIIRFDPSATDQLFIRTHAGQTDQAIAAFEKTFNTFNTDFPFEYSFLDTAYEDMYRSEVVVGKLTNYFTVLALFIACLGLFGLASFTTERRTREIAIRKVLGATVSQVVLLLSREFMIMISIAVLIGAPIAYFFLNTWLTGFAYHVPIGISVFATAALALVVITGGTIGYQSVKAALANPANSMRVE